MIRMGLGEKTASPSEIRKASSENRKASSEAGKASSEEAFRRRGKLLKKPSASSEEVVRTYVASA